VGVREPALKGTLDPRDAILKRQVRPSRRIIKEMKIERQEEDK
jgi:hypothetical protein